MYRKIIDMRFNPEPTPGYPSQILISFFFVQNSFSQEFFSTFQNQDFFLGKFASNFRRFKVYFVSFFNLIGAIL